MTRHGTFMINGTERVIVSQLHRSPGVFFDHDKGKTHASGKLLYSARIIPYRGSWIDFEFDPKDILYVRIDRRRKFHATVLLRALGMTAEDLLNYFYRKDTIVLDGRKAAKRFVPDHLVGVKATRDLRNPQSNELIVKEGRKFTRAALRLMEQAGIEQIPIALEEVLGRVAAHDVKDSRTGEVLLELLVGDLLVGREQDLARPRVLDVVRRGPAEHLLEGDGNLLDAGLLHQPERRPGELAALLDDQLVALRVAQVAGRLHAHQVIGHEAFRRLAAVEDDGVLAVKVVEEVLGGHAEGAQEDGGVELPPPVDTHVEDVLGVELEIDPRAAVGDDARRVEELAAGVRLPLVVVEEHAWRAMELRDDHSLRPVDHERPVAGHERDVDES